MGLNAEKIVGTVLVIAITIAVGLLVISQFGQTARTTSTELTNQTISSINTTTTFTGFTFISDISSCANSTGTSLLQSSYTVVEGSDTSDGGLVLTAQPEFVGQVAECSVTHLKPTTASTSVSNLLTKFTTTLTWLGILIVVGFAAIILVMVKRRD